MASVSVERRRPSADPVEHVQPAAYLYRLVKRVLVVSYFYPPYSSVGATRVSKMTRYLADAGWDARVLTIDRCDLPATLPVEISHDAIVRAPQSFDLGAGPRAVLGRRRLTTDRIDARQTRLWKWVWHAGEMYRHLVCIPDAQIGWYPRAAAAGLDLGRAMRPDVVLSSSLPNTSHLVARRISKTLHVPWVAELRDLWTGNHNFKRVEPLRSVERRLERRVLSDADALVTVSEVWAETLRRAYGRPTFVVPNGYDPPDYPAHAALSSRVFTLAYTGMFYNGKQSAAPLFDAVAKLAGNGRINPESFRLQFVGQYLGPILTEAESRGVAAFTNVQPPVPYSESLLQQSSATALLFLDWFAAGAAGWYSAKIYEYLGAGRPILSIGPGNTVVSQLLQRTSAGIPCSTAADVERTLERWLLEFSSTGALAYRPNEMVRRQFQRKEAARQMGAVLDEVCGFPAGEKRNAGVG